MTHPVKSSPITHDPETVEPLLPNSENSVWRSPEAEIPVPPPHTYIYDSYGFKFPTEPRRLDIEAANDDDVYIDVTYYHYENGQWQAQKSTNIPLGPMREDLSDASVKQLKTF